MESGKCTALNISDESLCQDAATSLNGLFCQFHSNQCQGLYKGYKRRNARLDSLKPPKYLVESSTAVANQDFADVDSEETLREVHDYLLLRYRLLTRVIGARKLHHSRFFSMNMDYGHQHFLDNLQSQKFITIRALERLERRTGEVLFKQQEWFEWAKERQEEEENARENESKKVKREAALFKRYWNQFKARLQKRKKKEEVKKQEEYLEQAFKENMSLEEQDEASWDPIEDVVEDERVGYVDMIDLFLMIKEGTLEEDDTKETGKNASVLKKGKSRKPTAKESNDKKTVETKVEMRKRLRTGSEYRNGASLFVRGTINNPLETLKKVPPLPGDEIDRLLEEISEVKHLLFCRLLLSYAALLPAAIRASSVEEFLNDPEVKDADLRDLCLKMEDPKPQEVRDACADLVCGEGEDLEVGFPQEESQDVGSTKKKKSFWPSLPDKKWMPKRAKEAQKRDQHRLDTMAGGACTTEVPYVNFGVFDDEEQYRGTRMRVRLCGRVIYNYPSEKAMSRGGWLHFCIIAKDSNLSDAIQLCRTWDEFFELSILALYQYFPAASWVEWAADTMNTQLVTLGFIPYGDVRIVSTLTTTQNREMRRARGAFEARNFVAAHVKRNDQTSRRLIRYLSMQTNRVLLLVRDATDGRILIEPSKDEQWLLREKSGVGRTADWIVRKEIGDDFYEELEKHRNWHLGFSEYYDLIVWDREAGQSFGNVFSTILEMLFKAHRCRKPADSYNVAAPMLKSLTRDDSSHRTREIKTGEEVKSIFDEIHDEGTRFRFSGPGMKPTEEAPLHLLYGDDDMLEDQILFPEEYLGEDNYITPGQARNALDQLEKDPRPEFLRFIHDLDTDEELSEEEAAELEYPEEFESSGDEISTQSGDDSSEGKEMSLSTSNAEQCTHDKDMSFPFKKSPLLLLCDELKIPVGHELAVAMCTELGLTKIEQPTEPMTEAEKVAFISIYNQYVSDSGTSLKDLDPWEEEERMKKEIRIFMDRDKAKAFKDAWHRADLEPGSRHKYFESTTLVNSIEKFDKQRCSVTYIIPFAFLRLKPLEHRRVIRDMRRAFSMMCLFFPHAHGFLVSEHGNVFQDHNILNQAHRATMPPDRRRHDSNKTMPRSFWRDWDDIRRNKGTYPAEWNLAVRPILARLYQEGIIRNSYSLNLQGQATAAKEPGRDLDMYIDFRNTLENIESMELETPPSKENLFGCARRFAAANEDARFAFLRTWSSPHFYPLMIGHDRRDALAFADGLGRAWEWKFIPKDMIYSEWSMHHNLNLRMRPYRRLFGDSIVIRRDSVLVMAADEDELLKLASAVTYALQTDTWRLEVDLWRSFVNVNFDFLQKLDDVWIN